MKRYLLLLTVPSLAMAMERTAGSPPGALMGGANGGRVTLPVCHPSQALTVKNGGFACMNVQPNVMLIGSCATTYVAASRTYQAEVLCPAGYAVANCSGGSLGEGWHFGSEIIEPFTQNDRQGCRAFTRPGGGVPIVQAYAQCVGEPGLTARFETIPATGCYMAPAPTPLNPGDGGGGDATGADSGEGGDAGGDGGGDGDGG